MFLEVDLLDHIDEATKSGFICATPNILSSYEFVHAIVKEAIYEELNPDRKVRLHRNIARALEKVPKGRRPGRAADFKSAASADSAMCTASWYTGEFFAEQFNANMTVGPKVVDWLKGVLSEYGVAVEQIRDVFAQIRRKA